MKQLLHASCLAVLIACLPALGQDPAERSLRKEWRSLVEVALPNKSELDRVLGGLLASDRESYFEEVEVIERMESAAGLYRAAIEQIVQFSEQEPLPVLTALANSNFDDQDIQNIARVASEALVKRSPQQLFDYLSNVPGGEGLKIKVDDQVLQEMLVAAFRLNPNVAFSWIKGTSGRISLLEADGHSVLRAVAEVSPESVVNLARDSKEIQLHGLNHAFGAFAKHDLKAATEALSYWKLRGFSQYDSLVIAMARAVGESDGNRAREWSESLGEDGLRARFYLLAEDAPDTAAKELLRRTDLSDILRGKLSHNVVRHWAKTEPDHASVFLEQLSAEGIRYEHSYVLTAEQWLRKDLKAGSAWVASIDDDGIRNACIRALISKVRVDDPERGFLWALQLPEDKLFVGRAFRSWFASNPEAATARLRTSELPEGFKQELLKSGESAQRSRDARRSLDQ